MPSENDRSRVTVQDLAARARPEMIPVTSVFSYFATLPIAEDDLRQYLQEPIAALSPVACAQVGPVGLLLAPYLERANGKGAGWVYSDKPAEGRQAFWLRAKLPGMTVLALAVKDVDMADYHYHFYNGLASVLADTWDVEFQERYHRLLRDELGSDVHGEVDEASWHLKQSLVRRQTNTRKETKLFRDYARQSFEDTLTLYLHGTCCDIDVDTGPRQMPSRYLRRRLELLESLYPPPDGYAVFPEELTRKR